MSELQLKTLIGALMDRDRFDEAVFYSVIVPIKLYMKHGISEKEAMDMTIDRITQLLSSLDIPYKYDGWNFWWGKSSFESGVESYNA